MKNKINLKTLQGGIQFWKVVLQYSLAKWEAGRKQLIFKKIGMFMTRPYDLVPWHESVLGTMTSTIFVALWDVDLLMLLSNTFWHDYDSWPLWIWMVHCQTSLQDSVNTFRMNVTHLIYITQQNCWKEVIMKVEYKGL